MAILDLINVTKSFSSNIKALDSFNMNMNHGELVTIVGPSGCGKSTLLRVIAGLEEVTSGKIILNGREIQEFPPNKRNMAMMFQNYVLFPHLNVYDNMAFGLKLRKIKKTEIRARVEKTAGALGLEDLLDRYPHHLSGGQRQRTALARAVLRQPDLFLLDEPLSNLDAKMRTQMRAEISRIQKNLGTNMIFVTHDQTEAITMGDRIIVLNNGKVQQTADPVTLYEKPVNIFVAGFIGSPAMNFFKAEIINTDGNISVKNSVFQFTVPGHKTAELNNKSIQNLLLGIRPEHMGLFNSPDSAGDMVRIPFSGEIEFIEKLGSHSNLHMKSGCVTFIARADAGLPVNADDGLNLWINTSKIHFFDKNTGLAL